MQSICIEVPLIIAFIAFENDCYLWPLQARVLATIGVTRGFGDHNLTVLDTGIRIKPFLTPAPEVFCVLLPCYLHGVMFSNCSNFRMCVCM